MYIDTHCHISIDDYDDIEQVIKEDFEVVDKIVISGCSKEYIREAISIANSHDNIFVTIGYHPDQVDVYSDDDLKELEELLLHPKVIGVGEIGLDYHYEKDKREKQIELFEKQLEIAERFKLPVVIHSRDATLDTINTLKKYNVRGIIHAFGGSYETAMEYINMGYLLGIGGVITFTNSNLGDVVSKIGVEHLVLETDSPYLTPHPFRGKGIKNSSKYLPFIAKKIADVTNKSLDEVINITGENAITLFDLTNK